jgi:hypothetical protein
MTKVVTQGTGAGDPRNPVGIGPVIAGYSGDGPVYYVDLVFPDGSTDRLIWEKARRGADRGAKLSATRKRISLAEQLRPEVVLAHDQQSFQGLVTIIQGLVARNGSHVASGAA